MFSQVHRQVEEQKSSMTNRASSIQQAIILPFTQFCLGFTSPLVLHRIHLSMSGMRLNSRIRDLGEE